jgi:hypothetical protein
MPEDFRKFRIFAASPGDCDTEREQLARVVNELNITIPAIAPEKRVVLELVRWETHVHPAIGEEPQSVVNEQIGDYDIFVGILWKRMGTPTSTAVSGTEEEFRRAYRRWSRDRELRILFYFCQQPFAPPRTRREARQLYEVVKFRRELDRMGIARDYATHEQFAERVRPDLLLALGRMLAPQRTAKDAAEGIPAETTDAARQTIVALAAEYEKLRETMPPGSGRTRRMEVIASHMRSLALSGYPLLPNLVNSASAGERLAATTFLQAIPNRGYLPWIVQECTGEKPFVGYHAALAMLAMVRSAKQNDCELLDVAIRDAQKDLIDRLGEDKAMRTDRYRVLQEARREWESICGTGANRPPRR